MNIDRILQINRKVEIAVDGGEFQANLIWGKSLIQAVQQNSFSILVPMKDGHVLYVDEGEEVKGLILADGARYTFQSQVISKQEIAGVRYVFLKKPLKFTNVERRNLVRVKTLISITYEVLEREEDDNWRNIEPEKEATVVNLSGVGICMSQVEPLAPGLTLILNIPLEIRSGRLNLKLLGRVVRCEKNRGIYRIPIKFIKISGTQQDLIMKYVSQMQRKYIQLYKEDGL